MPAAEFWRLTWWEWGMCAWEIYLKHKRRQEDQELLMRLTGDFMSLFANANRDPKKTAPFKRADFYPLSYDTQLTEDVDPELFNTVARRLGGTIKKRNGNK